MKTETPNPNTQYPSPRQKPGLGNDALATRWSEAGDTYLEAVEAAD